MSTVVFTNPDNVALNGYDVVCYSQSNEARRGSSQYSAEHGGATYYFTSAENRDRFTAKPGAFLPAFGGFCAFAVAAKNAKAPSDPRTFKFYNGKLLLFFNDYYEGAPFNTIVPWNAEEERLFARANENWSNLS